MCFPAILATMISNLPITKSSNSIQARRVQVLFILSNNNIQVQVQFQVQVSISNNIQVVASSSSSSSIFSIQSRQVQWQISHLLKIFQNKNKYREMMRSIFHKVFKRRNYGSGSNFVHRNTPTNHAGIPFSFSSENQERVKEILSRYPSQYKKAAVIPLLDLGQRQNNNFCSLSVMNHVAQILEMPPMRVYEVATFYTMFNRNPVGKYFVQVGRRLNVIDVDWCC